MAGIDTVLRRNWLIFGAAYGTIAFLASIIAAAIFAVILTPIFPSLTEIITASEPTGSILSDVSIPVVGGIIAGICIFGGIFISAIVSMIYWWITSWVYDLSKITPLWIFARKLPATMKMVYAGLLIPLILLAIGVALNVVDMNLGAAIVNVMKFFIQILWLFALVYATWFAMKMVRMKLPVETR